MKLCASVLLSFLVACGGSPKSVDANVGQADRVQHPAGGLGDPLWRIPVARFSTDALGNHCAQLRHIDKCATLKTVAERARGGQHGVLEGNVGDRNVG